MHRGDEYQNGRGVEYAVDERCDNVCARLRYSDAHEIIFVVNFEWRGDYSVGERVGKDE